jgi:hypothetical protein
MAEPNNVNLAEDTTNDHERLYNDYQQLENTLTEVKEEFSHFAHHIG